MGWSQLSQGVSEVRKGPWTEIGKRVVGGGVEYKIGSTVGIEEVGRDTRNT